MSALSRTTTGILVIGALALSGLVVFTTVNVSRIERRHPPAGHSVDVDGGRLHVVELGAADAPSVVLLHGASNNLEDMRLALGDRLAARYRVILIDRPGHGWSDRPGGSADASPARQAQLIRQALNRLGVGRPILVAHSWGAAVATAYALEFPQEVAGLVLLAPLTHPMPNTSAWHSGVLTALLGESARSAALPVVGPLVAHTFALPLGKLLLTLGVHRAFFPQQVPADYLARSASELLLRPSEFTANAEDLAQINDILKMQAEKYPLITVPTVILAGDDDEALSMALHARAFVSALQHARLDVLPGVGHMIQHAAPAHIVDAVAELSKSEKHRVDRSSRD